jgi:hypothetical protein
MQRFKVSLVLAAAALVSCSDSSSVLGPSSNPQGSFSAVEVRPSGFVLATVAPGNTVVLTVRAVNSSGDFVSSSGAVVTYTSSAPATASVSEGGIVTGLAAGDAVITVAMTLQGETHTADATITVLGPGSWPSIGGVYDLTASILGFDPAWGDLTGEAQISVVTIQHNGDTPQFTGTFEAISIRNPDGTITTTGNPPGTVSGTISTDGHVVMELTNAGMHSSYWYGSGMMTAQGMAGNFGAGGHITGTFVAIRR